MKLIRLILFLLLPLLTSPWCVAAELGKLRIEFYGDTIEFPRNASAEVSFDGALSMPAVASFYERMTGTEFGVIIDAIQAYREKNHPDDWIYYQLIRKTAQALSPKADNYYRYTLYKCFLLDKSGYPVALEVLGDKLLFFVQSDEDIFDVPSFKRGNKQYVCLNFHDYNFNVDLDAEKQYFFPAQDGGARSFSYKLTRLPDFRPEHYHEKNLEFTYGNTAYGFKVKLNHEVKNIFTNYPVADYGLYFNAPLSKETYNTLIPQLREKVKALSVKGGVDYLMRFTRYAFPYEADNQNFGREKRLSPEQTLLYDNSDCEDRAALFYCLVKELYNLPMIVVTFPHHVAIGVSLDKPVGRQIVFNGTSYSVCEPTPQGADLPLGALSAEHRRESYEVAYCYSPAGN